MTTIQKIAEIIVEVKKGKLSAASIKPESRLSEDLDIDSIGLMEALVLSEEAFGISISPHDVTSLKTVAEVVSYVDKLAAK